MDTIKVPGVGPVKKPMVIAGVGVVAGVVVYAYWRRAQESKAAQADAAAAAQAAATGTDAGAYDSSSYVEDSTAAGYNTVYPSAYSGGFAPYGYDIYGNPLPPPVSSGSNGVYQTNSDWATAAESALEDGGVALSVSTLAISRVLGGLSVTSAQRDIFMEAVGLLGNPPQGYPTPIKLTDSGTGPSPTPGGPLPAPTGLHVTGTSTTHVSLAWNAVAGADYYRLYRNGVSVTVGASKDTHADVGGLSHNTTYRFHVRAVAPDGTLGAPSADVSARTKK